jgi:hypothetical protein
MLFLTVRTEIRETKRDVVVTRKTDVTRRTVEAA